MRRLRREGLAVARLLLTSSFLDDVAGLDPRAEEAVWAKLRLVASFPGVGSSLIEPSLTSAFGDSCLKVSALMYDILYKRMEAGEDGDEVVVVAGVIPQRRVR